MNTRYVVWVDDNFHYMDESERSRDSDHATAELAIERCKAIVDAWLHHALANAPEPMTAAQLLEAYVHFGDDPFVTAPAGGGARVAFSARDYARKRAAELCPESGTRH